MKKLVATSMLFLSFQTFLFGEVREPQKMERITREIVTVSEPSLTKQSENKKQSWVKRHPVIAGTLIGFGAGAFLGQASNGDYSVFGKVIWFGGIGAGVGALVGKVASEY